MGRRLFRTAHVLGSRSPVFIMPQFPARGISSEQDERGFLPPRRSCCSLSASFSFHFIARDRAILQAGGSPHFSRFFIIILPRIFLVYSFSLSAFVRTGFSGWVSIAQQRHCSCRGNGRNRTRNFIRYPSVSSALSSGNFVHFHMVVAEARPFPVKRHSDLSAEKRIKAPGQRWLQRADRSHQSPLLI